MEKEIEAKFLNVNHVLIRKRLKQLGAKCKYLSTLMHRTVYDYPDRSLQDRRAWVRLREELDGSIELMLKQVKDDVLGETYEQALKVDNYESTKKFLTSIGLEIKGEQESKRELWEYNGVEIMLDEWPWVPQFIEIEGPSEDRVKQLSSQLDLNWEDACFGGVTPVYAMHYGIDPRAFEALELSMKFSEPVPEALKNTVLIKSS